MSADFLAGYISGAIGIIIGNPLDLLKVRLQASSLPSPSTRTSSTTSSQARPRTQTPLSHRFTNTKTLITGTAAPILGYGALNALLFLTYNRTETYLTALLSPTHSIPTSTPSSASTETQTTAFHPGQNLLATFLAGAVGGLATWIVSTPTELVKCRTQIASSSSPSSSSPTSTTSPPPSSSATPSSYKITTHILRTHGLRGLYFGGTITALRDSLGYGFYFWSYELCGRWMSPYYASSGKGGEGGHETAKVLLCGGIAGIVTWASIFPLDVVKTRVQTQEEYLVYSSASHGSTGSGGANTPLLPQSNHAQKKSIKSAWTIAKQTYAHEGPSAFFRGLGVCSVRAFVVNAVQWGAYEWIMQELGQGRNRAGVTDTGELLS